MKKFLLLVLSFYLMASLSAQMDKGSFIFSVDGDYTKTSSETGVISNLHVITNSLFARPGEACR